MIHYGCTPPGRPDISVMVGLGNIIQFVFLTVNTKMSNIQTKLVLLSIVLRHINFSNSYYCLAFTDAKYHTHY